MKVFLSWSGEKSKKIAGILCEWLPTVIQTLQPFYSPDDIEKGRFWPGRLSDELSVSDFGIVILTQENLNAPWILFEAGALSKNISSSRVCTLLMDVKDTDVTGPLALFQNTKFIKDDIRRLLSSINNSIEKPLEDKILTTIFNKMWPDLEKLINKILKENVLSHPSRPQSEMVEECLRILRDMHFKHIYFRNSYERENPPARVIFIKDEKIIMFYSGKDEVYWKELDELKSTGDVLDLMFQILFKTWFEPKHITDLMKCLEEVTDFYFDTNAQGVFCPFGSMMEIDWENKVYKEIER